MLFVILASLVFCILINEVIKYNGPGVKSRGPLYKYLIINQANIIESLLK